MINQVHNEDCILTLARMESGSVDLMLTDSPFGCTQNDWDIKPDLQQMWPHWNRVVKQNGAMIFFATQPFASELIMSNIKNFRYDLIWQKSQTTGFLNCQRMPLREHEYILIFYRKLPVYNPQIYKKSKKDIRPITEKKSTSPNYGKYKLNSDRVINQDESYPKSVLYFENEQGTFHSTQKPLDLFRYLIKTYSNENDLVFDGYMGSGTTAIACIKEKRNYIGSELDPTYFALLTKRINFELQQSTLF